MNTLKAFMMGELNRGKELMVFDWVKAAKIIKERKPDAAVAGLEGDFEYTAGTIWRKGEMTTDDYTYLASTWATPTLVLDGGEEIPCFRMESEAPGWDENTKWPEEAVKIVEGD